jgi:hypothetical protein
VEGRYAVGELLGRARGRSTGPREPGEVFRITSTRTFRWMATDIKGNKSFGVKIFWIED